MWCTQQSTSAHPGDLRRALGNNSRPQNSSSDNEIVVNGKRYRSVQVHRIHYHVSQHNAKKTGSLVDRGANGGLAGSDVRIVHKPVHPKYVDVSGIDSHQVNNLPLLTVGGVVHSQRGPVIAIMHQYAYLGTGKTIHSSGQLEWYKNDVNDRSLRVPGGLQRITTNDGYVHPLNLKNGLPYISIRPYTDEEWDTLPHVIWTSDQEWDPKVLDCDVDHDDTWYDAISDLEGGILHSPFDEFGNYKKREVDNHDVVPPDDELQFFDAGERPLVEHLDDIVDDVVDFHNQQHCVYQNEHQIHCNLNERNQCEPDYESLRPFFLHASADVVKHTFAATTQYAKTALGGIHLKKIFRSPFPGMNVPRRHEAVATDTVFADVPAVDNGSKIAQLFVGRESLVIDAYPMKTEKQFVNTLEDNIRKRGAMDKLISDCAQVEASNRAHGDVKEVLADNLPSPLGKPVVLTTYVDANLYHDMVTGRSVSGILHLVNQTPFEWFSKKQGTVETATYGSEFVAARIATEQIIANRMMFRYLGIPVHDKTYMFGDNKSVVDSSAKPHAVLHKRHNALSFHRVREAIASGIIHFKHIDGPINPADILSKHWAYPKVWPMLQPLLFWEGNTQDLLESG